MGVLYTVACHDHKEKRNLDKIKVSNAKDKNGVELYSEKLEGSTNLYKEAILLSFMDVHCGCNVSYFSEFNDDMEDKCRGYNENKFWL